MPKLRIGPKRPLRAFLAEWRDSKGLTQDQMGGRFDPPVEKGQVSKWETAGRQGAINTAVVAEYAEALGIKDARRLYGLPPKGPEPPTLDQMAAEQGIDKGTVAAFIESVARRRAG